MTPDEWKQMQAEREERNRAIREEVDALDEMQVRSHLFNQLQLTNQLQRELGMADREVHELGRKVVDLEDAVKVLARLIGKDN